GIALLIRGDFAIDPNIVELPYDAQENERRVAIVTTARVADMDVSIAATHLSVHQNESQQQLDVVLTALANQWPPQPQLLLGDLNRNPSQIDAIHEAGFTVADTAAPTFPVGEPTARIDHVAVKGFVIDDVAAVAEPVSDHRALVVELSLPT